MPIGPFKVTAGPTSAAIVGGSTGGIAGSLSLTKTALSVNSAFTGQNVIDHGYANLTQGTVVQMNFAAGALKNGPGNDFVLFDAIFSPNAYTVAVPGKGSAAATSWTNTGVSRAYYYASSSGIAGPYTAQARGAAFDLSKLGVADGATVNAIQVTTTSTEADMLGIGVISPSDPTITVKTASNQKQFHLTADAAGGHMPHLVADATLDNSTQKTADTDFTWTAEIKLDHTKVAHAQDDEDVTVNLGTTHGGHLDFPTSKWTILRGGTLILTAKATVDGKTVKSEPQDRFVDRGRQPVACRSAGRPWHRHAAPHRPPGEQFPAVRYRRHAKVQSGRPRRRRDHADHAAERTRRRMELADQRQRRHYQVQPLLRPDQHLCQ